MHIPEELETERLILRTYRAGDGSMLYAAGLRNRAHLAEFESSNVLMHLNDPDHAEATARQLAADWAARTCFFIGILYLLNILGPTETEFFLAGKFRRNDPKNSVSPRFIERIRCAVKNRTYDFHHHVVRYKFHEFCLCSFVKFVKFVAEAW